MSLSAPARMIVLYMLLGAALAAVVFGVGLVVYHQTTARTASVAAAPPAPAVAEVPASAVPPPVKVAPPVAQPRPAPVEVAPVEEAPPAAPPVDEAALAAEEAAKKAAEQEAKEKAFQAEVEYMGRKFDQHKPQFMNLIDTYYTLPAEQRADYLRTAFQELQQTIQDERVADGMPARPADQRRVGMQMLRVAGERLNEDEKKKVTTFMGDVMQSQMARMQADMQRQMNNPPPAPAP